MASGTTLKIYLDKIRECEDPDRLEHKFKIYDNWPILFYGNPDEIFSKVTSALVASPQECGIRDTWNYSFEGEGGRQVFNYLPGTVEVQIKKSSHALWTKEEDEINRLCHSVWAMFQPYQEKKMKGVHSFRAIALAIVGFGDYILRENLTARFPKNGLDLNYIP